MFYNLLFALIILYAIWIKKNELCVECTANKYEQIFQIVFVAILSYIIIGPEYIVKLVLIILASFIIKGIVFYVPKKITDCYYCHTPWKRNSASGKDSK